MGISFFLYLGFYTITLTSPEDVSRHGSYFSIPQGGRYFTSFSSSAWPLVPQHPCSPAPAAGGRAAPPRFTAPAHPTPLSWRSICCRSSAKRSRAVSVSPSIDLKRATEARRPGGLHALQAHAPWGRRWNEFLRTILGGTHSLGLVETSECRR